jgi:carboxypeptidase Taq
VEQANLREMTRQYQQAAAAGIAGGSQIAGGQQVRARLAHSASGKRLAGFAEPERGGQTQPRRGEDPRRGKGCSPYDALLDIFEPDMTSARLDVLFADLKSWLPDLLQRG